MPASPSTLRPSGLGVALLVSLAAQLYVLYAPVAPGPVLFAGADKLGHAAIFALPTLLALALRLPVPAVLAVLALHAPVSEVLQASFLPDRSGDPFDVVADLTGIVLGYAAWRVLWRQRSARGG